jgi:Fe2+ or Zn2+ uptake regulation protein
VGPPPQFAAYRPADASEPAVRIVGGEHFRCTTCGKVLDVPARSDTAAAETAARRAGLQVDRVEVVLQGRCAGCA